MDRRHPAGQQRRLPMYAWTLAPPGVVWTAGILPASNAASRCMPGPLHPPPPPPRALPPDRCV